MADLKVFYSCVYKLKIKLSVVWSVIYRSPIGCIFVRKIRHDNRPNVIFNTSELGCVKSNKLRVQTVRAVFNPDFNALYAIDGNLIAGSSLVRGEDETPYKSPKVNSDSSFCGSFENAFFGGILFGNHYGHFLTESLARLWPLIEDGSSSYFKKMPILFRLAGNKRYPLGDVSVFVKQVFEALGIWERIVIPDHTILVDNIFVAEPSIVNNFYTSSYYCRFMKNLGRRILHGASTRVGANTGRKVYLSRSKLSGRTRLYTNERELEAILERRGFSVVHPQNMEFIDQLRMFECADEIVGPIGSAFHTIPLSGNENLKVKYLMHYEPHSPVTYFNSDAACRVQSRGIYCAFEHPLNLKSDSFKDYIIDIDRAVAGIFDITS